MSLTKHTNYRLHRCVLRLPCFVCMALMTLIFADAAGAAPVAWLKSVGGEVQVRAARAASFKRAREHQPLNLDDTIRTGKRGRAEITVSNGTRLILRPNVQVKVTRHWLTPVRAPQQKKRSPQRKR